MTDPGIKIELLKDCFRILDDRIASARAGMMEAQEAANSETKGSAGDKHETGRAMMQIERDKHARMYYDAMEEKKILSAIDIATPSSIVNPGTLVLTDYGNFFISLGVGRIHAGPLQAIAISIQSPLGRGLSGRMAGNTVSFNGRNYIIREIV